MSTLKNQGYALLKNPKRTLEDFIVETESFGERFLYHEASNNDPQQIIGARLGRQAISERRDVFLSSQKGSTYSLPAHGELYYQRTKPPEMLAFFCETPFAGKTPQEGATLVYDGRKLFAHLSAATRQLFLSQEVEYTRYADRELWQKEYLTDDPEALVAFLKSQNIRADINSDGELKTTFTTSALREVEGEQVFINNLIPFVQREYEEPEATRSRAKFANGERISRAVLEELLEAAEAVETPIAWDQGDLLVVDNRRSLHGRKTLKPGPRAIYLRMGYFSLLSAP